jgi:hypothetical protein
MLPNLQSHCWCRCEDDEERGSAKPCMIHTARAHEIALKLMVESSVGSLPVPQAPLCVMPTWMVAVDQE